MEGDEVQEVNLQITGLAVKWAFRDWGRSSVPSTGGQCAPSRQSSSTVHLTNLLPGGVRSPCCGVGLCVCVRVGGERETKAYQEVFSMTSVKSQ